MPDTAPNGRLLGGAPSEHRSQTLDASVSA